MKNLYLFIFIVFISASCKDAIKNSDANIDIEKGVAIDSDESQVATKDVNSAHDENKQESAELKNLKGFWVGYFEKDSPGDIMIIDEGYMWNRNNKINLSIDLIKDKKVIGHSVVAGNDRPFEGEMIKEEDGSFSFKVKEPGDDKYDGEFSFNIKDGQLNGTWNAYKKIEIPKRKYELEQKIFTYNPDIILEPAKEYVNWNKKIETMEKIEMDENEFDEWISTQFATTTELIYKINASNRLLKKSEVENLKKGDLTIIRNTIYARHGYSYKNRPLRVFFDAQDWYIPVHSNIKGDFTEIEKTNIKLLLNYEQNAAEYYDSFGRG